MGKFRATVWEIVVCTFQGIASNQTAIQTRPSVINKLLEQVFPGRTAAFDLTCSRNAGARVASCLLTAAQHSARPVSGPPCGARRHPTDAQFPLQVPMPPMPTDWIASSYTSVEPWIPPMRSGFDVSHRNAQKRSSGDSKHLTLTKVLQPAAR